MCVCTYIIYSIVREIVVVVNTYFLAHLKDEILV